MKSSKNSVLTVACALVLGSSMSAYACYVEVAGYNGGGGGECSYAFLGHWPTCTDDAGNQGSCEVDSMGYWSNCSTATSAITYNTYTPVSPGYNGDCEKKCKIVSTIPLTVPNGTGKCQDGAGDGGDGGGDGGDGGDGG